MEPNKLENVIREKLGKREIQPSAQAWDRLDAMLSVHENKTEKKIFPWMQVAAGVILFLGVGYFVFNFETNSSEKIKSNTVTEIPVNASKESINDAIVVTTNSSIQKKEVQENIAQKEMDVEKRIKEGKKMKRNSNDIAPVSEIESQIVQIDKDKQVEIASEQKNNVVNNQVLAEIKTPVEKTKLKVDPNALLEQVDGEIQLTFRQKVMKTITKGYKEAKEAVVSRNQESSINH